MALYKPDMRYLEAIKAVEKLDDSEESELIKYYIKKKEDYIKEQGEELKKYKDFFKQMNRLLPSNILTHSWIPSVIEGCGCTHSASSRIPSSIEMRRATAWIALEA